MYYGISYNTNELAGDPFLNFALYGVIEIPAYALTLFVIQSKGRRRPEALSCLAAGLSCWLIYPIPKGNQSIGQYLSVDKDSFSNPPTKRLLGEAVVGDWPKMMKFNAL
ncbi:hypothetical protein AVEN_74771-1 [Araneus ventricosus]|uniref:Uncharacterized protein n=1 Tax=Araneus ventricosus TaxID=182803 RepID=A0A4Y2I7Q2_ARAVE|nr:hypothetical protein AVEN_74771-1 [Araneus ventricosus]